MFRRKAIIFYAKFWALFRFFYLVGRILTFYSPNDSLNAAIGRCKYIFTNDFIFAICKPFVVYITLLTDSIWWQGPLRCRCQRMIPFHNLEVQLNPFLTPDLNPDVIRRCWNEATLLSKISHPNDIQIFGVALLPPR